jgi:hypothetical protein
MRKIVLIVWSLLVISSCTGDENPSQESINRTVIVYMAADNDLDADALANHKTQPMQVNLLEQQTPKELLPP